MYIKKLLGKRLYLSPANPDDFEKFTHWINDNEVGIYIGQVCKSYSYAAEKEALEKFSKDSNFFIIVDEKTNSAIGSLSLMKVDHVQGSAELGIFIGDKAYWSRGYGSEAITLLLDYAFNALNLNNVMLTVKAFNERALACYKKCGFKEFGRRRKDNIIAGKRYDTVYMDILSEDFTQPSFIEDLIR